jgi:hypothetical protein
MNATEEGMNRGAYFKADLLKGEMAAGSPSAGGAFALATLPASCLLLMLFLEDPWFLVLAFIPAYVIFFLYVLSAVRHT